MVSCTPRTPTYGGQPPEGFSNSALQHEGGVEGVNVHPRKGSQGRNRESGNRGNRPCASAIRIARSAPASPRLKVLLEDERHERYREALLWALAKVAPDDPLVAESIEKGPWSLLVTLIDEGTIPERMLPFLERSLRSKEDWIRGLAATGLWKLRGEAEPLIPILRDCLRNHTFCFGSVRRSLFILRDGPEGHCPLRERILKTLAEMGPAARPLLPDVVVWIGRSDPVLRVLAVEAAWRISSVVQVRPLAEALGEPASIWSVFGEFTKRGYSSATRHSMEALRVLAEMGSAASEAKNRDRRVPQEEPRSQCSPGGCGGAQENRADR